MPRPLGHHEHARRVRGAVADRGEVDAEVLRGAVALGAGAGADHAHGLPESVEVLATLVGAAPGRVLDAHVDAVRVALGSEHAVFEVVTASAIGAALLRWDAAVDAIGGVGDATA